MIHEGDQIGEWRVESMLGRGGTGSVWRCRNIYADRLTAAIKIVPTDVNPELSRWVKREVAAMAALRHPSIVRVHTAGTLPEDRAIYVVMELVDGATLRDRMREGKPLTAAEAEALMLSVSDALAHAHTRGVHHCDIKPANILLPRDGPPMLVDFGVARMHGEEGTLAAPEGAGTPEYMAPESLHTGHYDPVSGDIYALGLVFWEALTGQRLFPPGPTPLSAPQRLTRVLETTRDPAPLDPGPAWPPHLRALVMDMTAPPNRRVRDMATVVQRLRNQEPTVPVEIEPTIDLPSLMITPLPAPDGEVRRWLVGGAATALVGGVTAAAFTAWWIGAI